LISDTYYRKGARLDKYEGSALKNWINHFEDQTNRYRTNNVLILWGDDFAHYDAEKTFNALEVVMKSLQNKIDESYDSKYVLKWSSMEKYL